MEKLFLLILFVFTLNLHASKLLIKINNDISESGFYERIEMISKSFFASKGYEVKDVGGDCNDYKCLIAGADELNAEDVLILNVKSDKEGIVFMIDLLGIKENKKYSVNKRYEKGLDNKDALVEFLLSLYKEILSNKNDKPEEKRKETIKDENERLKKTVKPDIPAQTKEQKNIKSKIAKKVKKKSKKTLRERRNIGINGCYGGAALLGFSVDMFILKYFNLELSFFLGKLPALGGKIYFSPDSSFSSYLGFHFLVLDEALLYYVPLGLEYMHRYGITFSVEVGVVSTDKGLFGETLDKRGYFPWGGLKLGYHF